MRTETSNSFATGFALYAFDLINHQVSVNMPCIISMWVVAQTLVRLFQLPNFGTSGFIHLVWMCESFESTERFIVTYPGGELW